MGVAAFVALSTPPLSLPNEAPKSNSRLPFGKNRRLFLDEPIILQYLGFETKDAVREYMFSRRGPGGESSTYFVTIANEAFVAHRARYQDAPAICSTRLRREFATQADHPPSTTFSVSDAELAAYRDAHTPPAKGGWSKSEEDKNF